MRMNKKGQVTIFIIIAILIVAAVVIFFTATEAGRGLNPLVDGEINVEESLTDCIENSDVINEKIDLIMRQGGVYKPDFYYDDYNNTEKLTYLCYTNLYYETCVMQNPMLLTSLESEIKNHIEDEIEGCFDKVKKELDRKGYDVSAENFKLDLELVPESILINIDSNLKASKGEQKLIFEDFEIKKPSKAYELAMIATSILNFEARYGDSEITNYMMLYPELRLIKLKQSDGTTLYFINYRDTGEKFYFASRSVVLPTGYTIE